MAETVEIRATPKSDLELLDDISNELIEDIQQNDPMQQLLDETRESLGINQNWENDPSLIPKVPAPGTLEGIGIEEPPPAPGPSTPVPERLQGPPPGPVSRALGTGASAVKRTGLMVIRGAGEAVVNTGSTVQDLQLLFDELTEQHLPKLTGDITTGLSGVPNIVGTAIGLAGSLMPKQEGMVENKLESMLDKIIRAPKGSYEETVRDLASVMTAMLPIIKGLQIVGAGSTASLLIGGMASEGMVIDPNSPSFVDAIGLLSPGIQQEIKNFIKSDMPDDEAERDFHDRLRQRGFRSLIDGLVADLLWGALGKIVKLARAGRNTLRAGGEVVEEVTETGERIALPQGRATIPTQEPASVASQMAEEQAQRGGAIATRPTQALDVIPQEGADVATGAAQRALPSGEAAGLLPPSSIQVADDALDIISKFQSGFSEADLDTVAKGLSRHYGISPEDTRGLIDAGLDLMRAAREKLGNAAFDKLGPGDRISLGVLLGALAGSNLVQMPGDEEGMQTELTQAGIAGDIAERFVKALKKIFRSATDEEMEKLTLRKQTKRMATEKKLVNDGEIIRETAEDISTEDAEKAAQFLADQPEKVTIAGKPHDINFNIIDTPDELRATLDRVSQLYEPEITAARRTGTSRASEANLARNMGMTVEQLHDFAAATELLPRTVVAANEMLVASAKRLNKLRDAVLGGDLNAEQAFLRQFELHSQIQNSVGKIRSEIGRGLGMYNVNVDGSIDLLRRARKGAKAIGKKTGVTVKELAQMHKELAEASPEEAAKFTREITKPTFSGALYEQWVNGLLTASSGVNTVGNVALAAWNPVERLMMAGESAIERGVAKMTGRQTSSAIDPLEAKDMLVSYFESAGDAMRLLVRNLQTGEAAFGQGKIVTSHQPQIVPELLEHNSATGFGQTLDRLGMRPDGWAGGFLNYYGKIWRGAGGGLLQATDDAFKLLNFRAELRAQAGRAARQQGLSGEDFTKFVNDFLANPPEGALDRAIKQREVLTFSNSLDDPEAAFSMMRDMGMAINSASRKQPILKMFFPFVRASVNVPTYAMERTPGISLMSRRVWQNMRSADPQVRAQQIAKIGTSMTTLGLVGILAHNGMIMGQGPANPQKRRQLEEQYGIKFNAIKLGDRWVDLNRADPIGWILATEATMVQSVFGNDAISDEDQADLAWALTLGQAEMLTSKTYMYTFAKIIDAIRGGRYQEGTLQSGVRIPMDFAGSMVSPAITSAIARQIDPIKREYNTLFDPIKNRIPWLSRQQPPVVNSAGEETFHTYGYGTVIDPVLNIIFPFATKPIETQHPGVAVIRKHHLALPLPSNIIEGVNINDPEADPRWVSRFRKLRSKEVKLGGKSLMDQIAWMAEQPIWDRLEDGPEGGKQIFIDTMRRTYTDVAKQKLMEEFPELRTKIRERQIDKMQGIMR